MASEDRVTVYKAEDGWRWHRQAANNEIVSESGEAFLREFYAKESAAKYNPGVPVTVEEVTVVEDEE